MVLLRRCFRNALPLYWICISSPWTGEGKPEERVGGGGTRLVPARCGALWGFSVAPTLGLILGVQPCHRIRVSRDALPAIRTWSAGAARQYTMVYSLPRRAVHANPIYGSSAQRRLIGSDGRVTPLIITHASIVLIDYPSGIIVLLVGSLWAEVQFARQSPRSCGFIRPVRIRHRSTAR